MNWPFAATIAVVLLIVTAAVMLGYLRTMRSLARRSGHA
jgi:ABC-type spermidine/putrescine transport system permease subunit I